MTLEQFKNSTTETTPPTSISESLRAMWHDARGEWESAHDIAQEIHSQEGSHIHAYLHRKEGDQGNAAYWYHRAKEPVCTLSLTAEWDEIVKGLLRNEKK
jgi:hypothetical protein